MQSLADPDDSLLSMLKAQASPLRMHTYKHTRAHPLVKQERVGTLVTLLYKASRIGLACLTSRARTPANPASPTRQPSIKQRTCEARRHVVCIAVLAVSARRAV